MHLGIHLSLGHFWRAPGRSSIAYEVTGKRAKSGHDKNTLTNSTAFLQIFRIGNCINGRSNSSATTHQYNWSEGLNPKPGMGALPF
jgi:hypothetical protein